MKKCKNNKYINMALIILGFLSIAIGLFGIFFSRDDSHSRDMLYGMFSGAGTGIVAVGIVFTVRDRLMSDEKKKMEEIEKNDERNLLLWSKSSAVGLYTISFIIIASCFVFVYMGYAVPAIINLATLYAGVAGMLIARRYFSKRM